MHCCSTICVLGLNASHTLCAVQDYYRKHSVPNRTPERRSRSLFSRMTDMASSATSSSSSYSSTRPSGHPNTAPRANPQTRPRQQRGAAPPRPAGTRPGGTQQAHQQTQYNMPSNSPYSYRPPWPPQFTRPGPSPNNTSRPASADTYANARSQSSSTAPATPPRPPPPPVPTMDALLEMTSADVHALSVGTLKSVLYEVSTRSASILSCSACTPTLAQLIRPLTSVRDF